jgi:hypothetical protein
MQPAPKKEGSEDEAIGRSRGGLSTKISIAVDALGNGHRAWQRGGDGPAQGVHRVVNSFGHRSIVPMRRIFFCSSSTP